MRGLLLTPNTIEANLTPNTIGANHIIWYSWENCSSATVSEGVLLLWITTMNSKFSLPILVANGYSFILSWNLDCMFWSYFEHFIEYKLCFFFWSIVSSFSWFCTQLILTCECKRLTFITVGLQKMVSLMGARFSKPLIANQVTHLICYKFEGTSNLL